MTEERMFPQPKEFVHVDKFVVKDSKGFYDRYWNFESGKWTGLLEATMMTKEEVERKTLPENGVVMDFEEISGVKKAKSSFRYA